MASGGGLTYCFYYPGLGGLGGLGIYNRSAKPACNEVMNLQHPPARVIQAFQKGETTQATQDIVDNKGEITAP